MKVLIKAIVIIVLTIFIIEYYIQDGVFMILLKHIKLKYLYLIYHQMREKNDKFKLFGIRKLPSQFGIYNIKKESETRETQFCIIFSISKEENLNEIEKIKSNLQMK